MTSEQANCTIKTYGTRNDTENISNQHRILPILSMRICKIADTSTNRGGEPITSLANTPSRRRSNIVIKGSDRTHPKTITIINCLKTAKEIGILLLTKGDIDLFSFENRF
ncbi:hypothetical protein N7533_007917 [Penicillium manginii]|uniref:uncharacterized protein n=1 Tax=Penicillium manginii TaxID=203109 RepID=UPI0025465FE1|nr:uncharacterized protein N7533_007917 [Penicillium manginii]KAJ5750889.1 hypothetical protein N7533_007917 [Penicillium manginii]